MMNLYTTGRKPFSPVSCFRCQRLGLVFQVLAFFFLAASPAMLQGQRLTASGGVTGLSPQIQPSVNLTTIANQIGIGVATMPMGPEQCADCIDNDGDGLIDCYDPDCSGNGLCDDFFFGAPTPSCQFIPPVNATFGLTRTWTSPVLIDTRSTMVVGDLDGDSIPEVVGFHRDIRATEMYIVDGATGALEVTIDSLPVYVFSDAAAIADIDNDGFGEIAVVTTSRELRVYEHTGALKWNSGQIVGYGSGITLGGFPNGGLGSSWHPSFADFNADGVAEIYVGNQIFNAATGAKLAEAGSLASRGDNEASQSGQNKGSFTAAADVLPTSFCADCAGLELIAGNEVYSVDLNTGLMTLQTSAPSGLLDGRTSIADWDQDGQLDVIVSARNVNTNPAFAIIYVWNPRTGTQIGSSFDITKATISNITVEAGHPNVADYDDDGVPEIGVAGSSIYVVIDNVGASNNLIELWANRIDDTSSRTTGSAFDFEGDGNTEVVYQDEDFLFVFDGKTGAIRAQSNCGGGTRNDFPTVVDVNADGQANIVCVCGPTPGGPSIAANGNITAWSSATNNWVSTRAVMNQHNYHVTNINDDLTVCSEQQNHGIVPGLNSFLTQSALLNSSGTPSFVAGDATIFVDSIVYASCSAEVNVRFCNIGDQSIPSGLDFAVYNGDPRNGGTLISTGQTNGTLGINACENRVITLPYVSPFDAYIYINDNGSNPSNAPSGLQAECDTTNNFAIAQITESLPTITAGPDTTICEGETVTLCATTSGGGASGGLFISEYVEGASFNKYIELYNGTASAINLSNYSLRLYSNGASTPNNNNQLSGTIASGGTVVLRNSSASIFNGTSQVVAAVNFNGDDAVVLWDDVNNQAVDIFGVIGNDPGSQWSISPNNTQNQTLRRNFNVTQGISTNPSGTGAAGFATLASEWTEFPTNNVADLGSHSSAVPGSGGNILWSNGATTTCITVTPSATTTYTATLTDGNNCSVTASATVTVNANPVVSFSVQDEGCFAAGDGSVTANVSSGTAPFSFSWSNGDTSATTSNLSAGTYSVTVMDAAGCMTSGSATVSGGTSPVVNGGADQTICLGDSVTLCAGGSGGVFFSEYVEGSSFNKYIEIYNGSGAMVDLSDYQLRVYFNGSGSPQSVGLSGMLASGGTAVFGNSQATAFGGNFTVISNANWNGNDLIGLFNTSTGQFEDVFGVFGQNPGSGGWSVGSITTTTNTTLRRIATVTQGVSNTGTTFPSLGTEWTAFATDNVNGLGAHTSIVPANISWSTGDSSSCTTVAPTTTTNYFVFNTDGNGCVAIDTVTVIVNQPPVISISTTDESCPRTGDGTATAAASGSGAFTFAWSNGATTASISGLAPGSYSVTVTDANGCVSVANTTIGTQPDMTAPVITCPADVTVDAGCGGQFATVTYPMPTATDNCDANVNVTRLSGPASGTTVPLGTFRVLYAATDTAGNVDTCGFNVTVTGLALPAVTAGPDTALCAGGTVTICANVPGATGVAGGLFISEYVEGSSFNKYIELYNGTNNTIDLSDYSLRLYSNGNSNPNNNNQLSGTIASGGTVVLRNSSAAIFNGPSLVVPAVNFNGDDAVVLWDNVNNRAVDIFGVIGNDPGSQWSLSGNNTQNQTLRRNFNVTMGVMTNPSGTGPTGFATLGSEWTEFAQNDASGLGTHSSAAPGSAGGSFVWSTGDSTQCITVTPGATTTYTVSYTDNNGCTTTASSTVTINPNPVVAFSVQDEGCFAAGDGAVTAVVSSGTAPFSYSWSNGSNMQTISNLSAGTYMVTVTDANGCTTNGTATVSGGTSPVVNGGPDQAICPGDSVTLCAGGAGGVFFSEYVEGSSFNKYIEIYNGTGAMVDLSNYQLRVYFNGSGNPVSTMLSGMLPSGGTAVFGNGSATVFSGNFTVISNANWNGNDLIALFNTSTNQFEDVFGVFGQNPGSNGWSAGSITGTANTTLRRNASVEQGVTNTGTTFPTLGTEWTAFATNDVSGLGAHSSVVPASVNWSTGDSTSCITVSPSVTTDYFVFNADANGCVAVDTVTVTVNTPPSIAVSTVDVTCAGDADGAATLSINSGVQPLSFLWSNGGTTGSISGLTVGTYSVTVTDGNGCTSTASGTVGVKPDTTAPVITCPADVVVDAGCGGQFATITYAMPTATDNCDANVGVTLLSGPASGTTVPVGTFPVTYQATDTAGNTATCSFNVTVTAKPLPTVSAGADVAVCNGESVQLCATVNNVSSGGLFISEYVEGSSFNKYIEIYNGGATTVNLADYSLRLYSNGAVTPNNNNSLAAGGSLAPGQTVVFKNSSAVAYTGTAFTLSAINFNGDDAVELYDNVNNRTIDIFGVIGQDPGSQWSFSGNNTQNQTLRRNASVTTGISVNPATFATLATEWTEFAQNDVSGLGSHNSVVPGNLSGTYTWTNGSNSSCITVTPGMTTTYAVTFTDSSGCASTDSVTVTVNPVPTVGLAGVDEGCFGAADGSVSAIVSSGTAPFTYNWSNGATGQTITGLVAGIYNVTVTDANGCTAEGSTTLKGGTSPTVDAGMDQAICPGDTATFSVDTQGGIFFSEYAEGSAFNKYLEVYNGTNDTLDLANFSVRTYFNGATSPQVTNNLAAGGLLPPGGTIVLQNTSAANFQGNALSIGAVNFNGDDAVVLWNDVLNAPMDIFGVIGNDPGSQWDGTGGQETNEQTLRRKSSVRTGIKVNPSGTGNTAFTTLSTEWEVFPRDDVSGLGFHNSIVPGSVQWSNGSTAQSITVSPSATTSYTVTYTDGNGCVAIDTVTLTVNTPPVIAVSTVDVTCAGDADGAATLSINSGVQPLSFLWSNGGTTGSISGLTVGTYSVTVTDGNGCTSTASGTVGVKPDTIAPVITCPADVTVNAGCGGQFATVTYSMPTATDNCDANVGVTLLSGPASGSTVPVGTFPVTYQATDTAGNTATCTFNVTVTSKQLPTVDAGADVAVCAGESVQLCATVNNIPAGGLIISEYVEGSSFNKYIEIYNAGSTQQNLANYSLRLYSNGAVTPNSNNSLGVFGTLQPGQTVVFSNSSAVAYTGPTTNLAAINFNGDDAVELYDDVNNISVDIFGVIGQDPGSQWSFGGNNTQNRTLRRNANVTTGISSNPATFATLATEWTEFAQNDVSGLGSHISVAPGSLTGAYTWTTGSNDGCITVSPTVTTTYAVTFLDTNGCSSTDSVTVTVNPQPSVALIGQDEGCFAAADGSVAAVVSSGTAPFTYNWSNGGSTQTITGLTAGIYSVTVTDANGCTTEGTTTISGGTSPTVDAGADVAICPGDSATLSVNTQGGIFFSEYAEGSAFNKYLEVYNGTNDTLDLANFSIRTYFNGSSTPQATNNLAAGGLLPPGGTIVLQNPSAANYMGNALNIGAVNFNGDDAVVLWNDVLNAPMDIFGVIGNDPGSQWDGTGGQETNEQTLRRKASVITGIKVNPSGTGNTAFTTLSTEWEVFGRDDVSGLGFHNSIAPGSVQWSTGSTAQSITVNPSATTSYTVTYTDPNGCVAIDTVAVIVNTPPVVATTSTDASCNGFADGTATANATGAAPFTYAWSNGQTSMTATGLAAGTYSVTVTDANGCTSAGSATVAEPAALVAAATATDASCNGFADGTATATATGGTAPFSFAWSNGGTTANVGGLTAGTYTVTVTDANGCTATATATVAEPAVLVANIASFANVKCNGENSGRATVAATGGTAPYSFVWSNGNTTATDTTLGVGTYTITVTDANFCTAATSITITEPTAIALSFTSTPSKCNLNDGTATVVASGGTVTFFRGYAFQWSTGSIAPSVSGLAPGTYTVTVTDANDCQATGSVVVGEVLPPSIDLVAAVDTACKGDRVRLDVVSTDSNASSYVYTWSSNMNRNQSFINALVNNRNTSFSVTVTDPATGCASVDSISFTVDNLAGRISCCDDQAITCGMSATIPVEITKGSGPYTVTYTDGTSIFTQTSATSPVNINVSPGATTTYDIVGLTNGRGCTGTICGKFTVAVNCDTVVANPCPFKLDFAADSAGNALLAGTVVTEQWADRGIHISVRNNHNSHPDKALIFDSSNPTGTDDDLGTPNQAFNGPGIGNGGGIGMAGQNDKALGNLLIIAENDRDNNNDGRVDDPDDEARGGDIIFDFDNPTTIEYITLVDLDEVHGAIMVCEQAGGGTTSIPFPNLGDNAVATVPVNVSGVTSFKVKFAGSGGIAEIGYCPDCNDIIDFNDLAEGEVVSNQYAHMGVRFSFTNNDVNNPDKGIVFNSAAPTGNDPDLGTPNRDFNNGPGIGNGGRRGQAGENNTALGNLLIIAENDIDADNNGLVDTPDDEQDGGEMTIDFDNATTVSTLTFVDLDDRNSQIVIEKSGGATMTIAIPYLGDNSVKEIAINQDEVERIRIQMGGSGALAEMRFCVPTCEEPNVYAGVLTSSNNSGCRTTVLEVAATGANNGLDYIDISIPCGTLQNLSNSLHLPMTIISSDPQSGISGIRISNIPAADSAGTLFTVTYTNCKTCRSIQRCNPLMAFGQGGCVYYREADGVPNAKTAPAAAANNENDQPVQGGIKAISEVSAFPNPFNTAATISFRLGGDAEVTVEIFSMTGVRMAELYKGQAEAGRTYEVEFRPENLSEGVYFYRVVTGTGEVYTDKLIYRR